MRHATLCILATTLPALTAGVRADDVLLIPNSAADTIMAFSPADGSLIDAAFIADPGSVDGFDVFRRPINAIDSGRGTLLVSDQFGDVVVEFGYDGAYVGIFSNAGEPDTEILDTVRGIGLLPSGELLVCSSATNPLRLGADSVVRFGADGALVDAFLFQHYGGIDGPFDALVLDDRILVSSDGREHIAQYTLAGTFTGFFARDPSLDFVQQLNVAANGNILVAVFSGGFVAEYAPDGTLVGTYAPPGISGYRGVAELDNGNLLVTTGSGVQEITRTGVLVETEFATDEARFIERVTLPPGVTLQAGGAIQRGAGASAAPDAADERGEREEGATP